MGFLDFSPCCAVSLSSPPSRVIIMKTAVTYKTAQSLPAVYSAVSFISQSLASIPLKVMQGDNEAPDTMVAELLYQPAWNTPFEFIESLARSLLLTGNAYAWQSQEGLELIHPHRVNVEIITDTNNPHPYRYNVTDRHGRMHVLPHTDLIHIRGASEDGILGQSPVTVCRESIGAGLNAIKHGLNVFENGAAPRGVLKTDNQLNPETHKKLVEGWEQMHQGSDNSGKTAVLERGIDYKPISMSNADAEWLKSREFQIAEIARMFNLPKTYLQDYSGNAYTNVTEARRALLTNCLLPLARRFEQALERYLCAGAYDTTIRFQISDFMRADQAARYDMYKTALAGQAFMSVDEVRELEGMQPMEADSAVVSV